MVNNTTEDPFELHNRFLNEYSVFTATEDDIRPKSFFSDGVLNTAIFIYRPACASINICGLVANIVNIMVYWRMGFGTTANINLFTLSVSDFIQNCFLVIIALFQGIYVDATRLRLSPDAVTYLLNPVFWSVSAFGSWMTAIISLERCVSVALPMKVKLIFTRKSITGLILGMILYQVALFIPIYMNYEIKTVPSTVDNVTMIYTEVHTKSLEQIGMLWFISFSLPTFLCFMTIAVGTPLLVIKLRQTVVARSSMTPGSRSTGNTARETAVAKVVITISTIYICCMSPSVAFYATSFAYPRFNGTDPYYRSLVCVVLFISLTMQSVSCFVNIFVYLTLSKKYKETIKALFGGKSKN